MGRRWHRPWWSARKSRPPARRVGRGSRRAPGAAVCAWRVGPEEAAGNNRGAHGALRREGAGGATRWQRRAEGAPTLARSLARTAHRLGAPGGVAQAEGPLASPSEPVRPRTHAAARAAKGSLSGAGSALGRPPRSTLSRPMRSAGTPRFHPVVFGRRWNGVEPKRVRPAGDPPHSGGGSRGSRRWRSRRTVLSWGSHDRGPVRGPAAAKRERGFTLPERGKTLSRHPDRDGGAVTISSACGLCLWRTGRSPRPRLPRRPRRRRRVFLRDRNRSRCAMSGPSCRWRGPAV